MKPLSIPSRKGCGTPASMSPTVITAPFRKQMSSRPRKKLASTEPVAIATREMRSRSRLGRWSCTKPWMRSSSKSRK